MDRKIREAQLKLLEVFPSMSRTFALSGGTALELFYLKHRFSKDLDFFSPGYNSAEIDKLATGFSKCLGKKLKLENELVIEGKARVRFYTVNIKGAKLPLKIDFLEDVVFKKPVIRKFNSIPVYDVKNIYHQKILILIGTKLGMDETGREVITGRKEARDIVDVYYLSKKIYPLHKFIKKLPHYYKRGLIYWYRTYSRYDFKVEVLDLDIYDKEFNASDVIKHFDLEIKKIIKEVV